MALVLNKCFNRKRDREWNAPSDEEKKTVALNASLDEFKKESLQLSKALKVRDSKGKGKDRSTGKNKHKNRKKGGRNTGNGDPWA